ncbi:MAG: hypothetical protein D6788_10385 [Planctomycetota bacterium]|nr:MAG: hypothetical protein D6788_10385 [Planctomycetota bacterium]
MQGRIVPAGTTYVRAGSTATNRTGNQTMQKWVCVLFLGMGTGLLSAAAEPSPANPTMSLEAVSINGIPLSAPTSSLVAAPGDVLTAKIFVRDFSPNGERLRAYQATLDWSSFESGEQGKILPKDYDATTARSKENPENAFIDTKDPDFVYDGRASLAVVDTISFGYRYLGVLVNHEDARPCEVPGKKYVCGTINLKVSDDAKGTFTIKLDRSPKATVLRNDVNQQIVPFDLEDLTVTVDASGRLVRIVSSDPPDRAIVAGKNARHTVTITFNDALDAISPADLKVEDGTSTPPRIRRVTQSGNTVTVTLEPPMKPGRWTTIVHVPSAIPVRFGCVPGDVDGSGFTDARDVIALVQALRDHESVPSYRGDINGDGAVDLHDALATVELIASGSRARVTPH